MKKLSSVEKMIINITDTDKYNIYRCDEDGIFTLLKSADTHECPHCDKECELYETRQNG